MLNALVSFAIGVAVVAGAARAGLRLYGVLRDRFGLSVPDWALGVGLATVASGFVLPVMAVVRSLLDGGGLAGAAEPLRALLWTLLFWAAVALVGAGLYAAVRHVDRADAEAARQREADRPSAGPPGPLA